MNLKDHNRFNSDFLDGKHASNSAENVPVLDSNAKLPFDQIPTGTVAKTVSEGNHIHDDIYYTEEEMDEMIATSEENTSTNINSAIFDAKNDVLTEVDNGYVSKTIYNDFESNTTLQLDEMVNSTDSRFTEVNNDINSLNEQLEQYKSTMGESIRSDGDIVNIGSSNSSSSININDGKISFIGNSQEIVNISDQEMSVTNIDVRNSLKLGYYKFVPRASGNLSLVWDEGNNLLKSGSSWHTYATQTLTATKDDHYFYTDITAYLTTGVNYKFTCETDGIWIVDDGSATAGTDTVEAFLSDNKDGTQSGTTHVHLKSNSYTFSVPSTGTWYLRFDVNKNGATHSFWNYKIVVV